MLVSRCALVLAFAISAVFSQDLREVDLGVYRVLEPVAVPRPLLAEEGRETWSADSLFATSPVDVGTLDLETFRAVATARAGLVGWRTGEAELDGTLVIAADPGPRDRDRMSCAVSFFDARRYLKSKLVVTSRQPLRVWLDGEIVGTKKDRQGADEKPGRLELELGLEPGRRAFAFETILPREKEGEPGSGRWGFGALLRVPLPADEELFYGVAVAPRLEIGHYLDGRSIGDVAISRGGEFVSIACARPAVPADGRRSWVEIRDVETWTLRAELPDAQGFRWTEDPGVYTYRRPAGKGVVVRIGVVGGAERDATPILEKVRDHRRLVPNLLLAVGHDDGPKAKRGVKLWRDVADRAASSRSATRLALRRESGEAGPDPVSAAVEILAAGNSDLAIADARERIGEEGPFVLFTRTLPLDAPRADDPRPRPREITELRELDLSTGRDRLLASGPSFGAASYSPDGRSVLVVGGVTTFGALGLDPRFAAKFEAPLGEAGGPVPNDYDRQLYLVERAGGATRALTREFDPSIESARWSAADGNIYASARDGTRISLFRRAPAEGAEWERIDFDRDRPARESARPLEVVRAFDLDPRTGRIVLVGSGARLPDTVVVLDSDRGTLQRRSEGPVLGEDPGDRHVVTPPAVQDFDVTMPDGTVVRGRVHRPSWFEPQFRWPAIVYYYGGTIPSERSFGGRYPKNYWAEKGYLVYVLTPSGATGAGQEFSSRHVGAWGGRPIDEIIYCTERFLEAYPGVDPERVGCIGASYGGYTTMELMTRTKLFRTGISHAGISSISSYWGEGYWGWSYSTAATAHQYPWNAPEVYVDRSPLFHADRFSGSLLLVHGQRDTNVPRGESDQMYTALRILGKSVEYLQIEDEDHHILHYPRRKLWAKSLLAWFDRELKGEPEWWDALYGPDQDR
ncbi:MAG: prolyl oligopeptidase family serine peptidase [Planctomycetota bacterium]